jgi:peptide/nickel transport system substrate-binding protein
VTDDVSILTLKSLVLEPLCAWRGGVAQPALFSRWTHDPAGREWIFHIRDGARYHDGVPCRAKDVVDFIQRITSARDSFGMKWSYSRYFEGVTFRAMSETALHVSAPHPFADILDIFTDFYLSRPDASGQWIVGTGPYRVKGFEPGRQADLEGVEPGRSPARLTLLAEPDADARLARVRQGSAQVACRLENAECAVTFADDLNWGRATSTLSVIYYLNAAKGFFTSPEARLAVNYAVDRARIIEGVFGGLAIEASTVVSPHHLGFGAASVQPFNHDPDMARRLLDQAPPGGELVLRTPLYMPEKAPEVSRLVQDDLETIGLKVRLEIEADRPEYARQIGRKDMGDMAIFDSSPHSTYRVLNDKVSSVTRGVWWQGHDDEALERLIRGANDAVDEVERERAYGRCLARLRANPPWLYLFHPVTIFASCKEISGLYLDPKGVLVLPETFI